MCCSLPMSPLWCAVFDPLVREDARIISHQSIEYGSECVSQVCG